MGWLGLETAFKLGIETLLSGRLTEAGLSSTTASCPILGTKLELVSKNLPKRGVEADDSSIVGDWPGIVTKSAPWLSPVAGKQTLGCDCPN